MQAIGRQHAASLIAPTEASTESELPRIVQDAFDALLERDMLAQGYPGLHGSGCDHAKLLAFRCKRRGFCPSRGARRMSQPAAHLVDQVSPDARIGQAAVAWHPAPAHRGRCRIRPPVVFMCRPRVPISVAAMASWQAGTQGRPGLPGLPA